MSAAKHGEDLFDGLFRFSGSAVHLELLPAAFDAHRALDMVGLY